MKYITTLLLFMLIGINSYSQNQNSIIIKINYVYLDLEKIDNKDLKSFQFKDILNAEGISESNDLKQTNPEILNYTISKGFPNLSWKDTVSISRTGQKVSIPPFWAVFKMNVPINDNVRKTLIALHNQTKLIDYTHYDFSIESTSVPNDTTYNQQNSLNGSIVGADINIEDAWMIETGEPWIKVAVHDDGIDTNHVDLQVLFGGGYDGSNFPEDSWGIDGNHGTPVAGIIGARRNDSTGIAGIAGGNGSDSTGVSLIDINYVFNNQISSVADFMAGVVDAARYVGSYWNYPDNMNNGFSNFYDSSPGFGVQIGNHSYTIRTELPQAQSGDKNNDDDNEFFAQDCQVCREAFLFSLRNGVINVVARANSFNLPQNESPDYVEDLFPQLLPDNWIISVGASGFDGATVQEGINQSQQEATIGYYSLYGANMDLIAPGSDTLVYTTDFNQNAQGTYSEYQTFNGTSSAAPHVSGVIALLLSHYNQPCYNRGNLNIEDVEYVLENSATDVYGAGYDDTTGWGRLNAGVAMDMIEHPIYQILHPDSLLSSTIIQTDTIALRYQRALTAEDWGPISSPWPLEREKNYEVERILVENEYDISMFMTPETEILASWARPSVSNSSAFYRDTVWIEQFFVPMNGTAIDTTYDYDIFDLTPFDTIVAFDTLNMVVRTQGYYYHFINKYFDEEEPDLNDTSTWGPDPLFVDEIEDYWYPIDLTQDTAELLFSLYIKDSSLLELYQYNCDSINLPFDSTIYDILNEKELDNGSLNVYPNPFNENITIEFNGMYGTKTIDLLDMQGRLIYSIETSKESVEIELSHLSTGIYFLNCSLGEEAQSIKILKR